MSQQYNDSNSELDKIIPILLFIGIVIGIGYLLFPSWKEFFFTMKMYELKFLNFITFGKVTQISEPLQMLETHRSWEIPNKYIFTLGYSINYLYVGLFFLFVRACKKLVDEKLFIYLNIRHRGFTSNPQALGDYVSQVYHIIKPIWGLDLVNQDPNEGAWASARKPHQIAEKYNLFDEPGNPETLNIEKTRRYFSMQLGRTFLGEKSLSNYQKAIIGIIAAMMNRETSAAFDAINRIARSFDAKLPKIIPDYSSGVALFEKYKNDKYVLRAFKRHAYVNTMIYGLCVDAKQKRKIGVFTSQQFIWLKLVDRTLFYTLNNEGRDKGWTECAAIYQHARYELELDRPMLQQFIQECVIGFKEEVLAIRPIKETDRPEDFIYTPLE